LVAIVEGFVFALRNIAATEDGRPPDVRPPDVRPVIWVGGRPRPPCLVMKERFAMDGIPATGFLFLPRPLNRKDASREVFDL
jgi:hypothetical protein